MKILLRDGSIFLKCFGCLSNNSWRRFSKLLLFYERFLKLFSISYFFSCNYSWEISFSPTIFLSKDEFLSSLKFTEKSVIILCFKIFWSRSLSFWVFFVLLLLSDEFGDFFSWKIGLWTSKKSKFKFLCS